MVLNNDRVWRPLRFLNFGDALHDELIKGWLPKSNVLVTLDVMFFEDHAIWENGVPGLYLLRLTTIDPADALISRGLEEKTLRAVAMAATSCDPERLLILMRRFKKAARCALEADVRWLRGQFTACINLDMWLSEQGSWVQVEAGVAAALLNPMAHERAGIPRARELRAAEADRVAVDVELTNQRQADATAARSAWSQRFTGFKESLAARLTVVDEEGQDANALAIREVQQAEEALEVARERGNRAQITRAENVRDFASDTLRMTRTFWEERVRWLQECEEEIRVVRPQEKLTALMRVRETQ